VARLRSLCYESLRRARPAVARGRTGSAVTQLIVQNLPSLIGYAVTKKSSIGKDFNGLEKGGDPKAALKRPGFSTRGRDHLQVAAENLECESRAAAPTLQKRRARKFLDHDAIRSRWAAAADAGLAADGLASPSVRSANDGVDPRAPSLAKPRGGGFLTAAARSFCGKLLSRRRRSAATSWTRSIGEIIQGRGRGLRSLPIRAIEKAPQR